MGAAIRLTGEYNEYPPIVFADADMVITKAGKVVKDRDRVGGSHRQATKAEIDAAVPVDPGTK